MAFVSATPVLPSARSPSFLSPFPTSAPAPAPRHVAPARPSRPAMQLEFQTYSGGLDMISQHPYAITRYLFKPAPQVLYAEDKESVINTALRHLFGNAYLMEEERAQFYTAESNYRCGRITAKQFARAVAKSETYRKRFFGNVTQFRFIELNFKHFLGRAPLNQVEYSKHFKIFAAGGYDAEIDSYFDDPEYDLVFGDDYFPFTRFRGTYAPINQFNRMCTLRGGFAASDKFKPQMLVTSLAANTPTPAYTVVDGLPPIPNAEHPSQKYQLPSVSLERFINELAIARARAYQLQIELDAAYEKLSASRDAIQPFKSMVSDMDITPLYGKNYGSGAVKVFTGQYEGAPAASWGASGVDRLNGPTRRPANTVSKKEKELERVKQLIVDLERRVAVLRAERESPALTPTPLRFELEGIELAEQAPQVVPETPEPVVIQPVEIPVEEGLLPDPNLLPDAVDEAADDSGVVVPKPVVVSTSRQLQEVGEVPKVLIEEMEAESKASGKSFLEGKSGKPSFPGDGSEMTIGG
ncbi:Phycobilisome 32.1 kDa linker polypeptide, phycocyanin-associated, rod [Gracilariopsis chorda]|uniref:Phycobilisome 32.1 kDa linker polypeptide, phycocyanin-associated, rod n=1 Tax=Gracilariopsis chorda TaxID=448386 RepID=A0A2V3IP86_9FLOR|nr:Phycobilisome 32.1 kDa linker polypeptide, phycocyanin-associated, rod [Gracilariopsis chorda]|eukprot:PXF42940.1 Phycobilisome 32.1 kDa linker polypeptide, phycocyanin-associated, rod [Gracilariopsis chorda]